MKNIIQLVDKLRSDEVRLIRAFLEVQSVNKKSHKLQLFNLIHSKMVKTNKESAMEIYQKSPNGVYFNLKSRLKHDIVNTILFQEASNLYSTEYAKAVINCNKWLLQGRLLVSRGVYGEGINILVKAEKLSKKFDLPGENALINEILRNHYIIREGLPAMKKYEKLIHDSNELYSKHIEAGNSFHLLAIPALFKSIYDTNGSKVKKQLEKLKKLHRTTEGKSERITFYYHVGHINYYILTNQFQKAKRMCLDFFPLIRNSVSLNTLSNNGGAHLEMTSILFRLKEFKPAHSYANKTFKIFRNSFNKILSLEYCFFGNYYRNKNKAALNVFKLIQNIPELKTSKVREEKWNYFAAYNYYMLGYTAKAKELLGHCKNLMINKSGWYLGKQLLLLMISIQEKQANPTIIQLENLLKVFRNLEDEHIYRFKSIYKVVRFLAKNQFDFNKTYKNQKHHLDLLKEGEGEYSWNPLGYEMIRFDEWFMSKVNSNKL
jgi:hypothetical protein